MSVRELVRNKKYQIEIPLSYNGNKKNRHFETFCGGKKDALLREAKLKMQLKEGSFVPKNNLTIQDLSEEYLNYKKGILSPKTYYTYCQRMILINEHIGYVKVRNITAKILDKFYTYLRTEHLSSKGTPYSPTTLQDYYALINNMLEVAVKWDYLNFNPNTKIEKPKRARSNASCYSKEDMVKLLQCLMQEPLKYQAIIITALDLACRRGELTGLTWDDIDFKTEFGGDIHPDTPTKIFQKIIKKYNLKPLTFHGLRHSGISHMIECGVPISVISRKVGHSSVPVTDTYYSHFFESEFKQVANSMNDIFEKAQ